MLSGKFFSFLLAFWNIIGVICIPRIVRVAHTKQLILALRL